MPNGSIVQFFGPCSSGNKTNFSHSFVFLDSNTQTNILLMFLKVTWDSKSSFTFFSLKHMKVLERSRGADKRKDPHSIPCPFLGQCTTQLCNIFLKVNVKRHSWWENLSLQFYFSVHESLRYEANVMNQAKVERAMKRCSSTCAFILGHVPYMSNKKERANELLLISSM